MNRRNNERFIIILVSIAAIGLSLESILMGWEFWVPPLIILGVVALWITHIAETPEYKVREVSYLVYTMLIAFYHGVHGTSYFDVAIVIILTMSAFSLINHVYMINLLLVEYGIILAIQLILAVSAKSVVFDTLNVSRLFLHITAVIMVYFSCLKLISDRMEMLDSNQEKEERIKEVDADMEDFLSNISHELRTPVNVVLGMSEIQIKNNAGEEALNIKKAGARLANQIADIQDYTECKRDKVILEEEEYLSTSIMNDVAVSFRMMDNENDLELIIDLDPMVPTKMIGDVKKLHKMFRHLMENAIKFTRKGGIYIRVFSEPTDYGVNLCIEVIDTGIGIDNKSIAMVSESMYQVNKKRNRNSGGIGLGLYIVYGFVHSMGGFVKIESARRSGTTVRVTIPQKVVDSTPCLQISEDFHRDLILHNRSEKYKVPKIRDFYRAMAANLAKGIRVPLYNAETLSEIEHLMDKLDVSAILMGKEEYEENAKYFDELSKGEVVIAVSAPAGFKPNPGSRAIIIPKPTYGYPVTRVINEGLDANNVDTTDRLIHPDLKGIRALVVDDEPMNLVVAAGIFKDYEMITETATSGKEAIAKFRKNDYDVIFMDHMMPEMDGVEAMKRIKAEAKEMGKKTVVVALTANAVSGARAMFMKEGFDGFIAKPINIPDFERVMNRELAHINRGKGGQVS